MALSSIAFIAPNYRDFKTHWLKAYEPGTTTPKSMALDSGGAVTVAKLQLNADGFLESAGGALVIPYIEDSYDLWLFPTGAEADANDTSNAERLADDINALNTSLINDLSQTYNIDTAQELTSDAIIFPVGKKIAIKERPDTSFVYALGGTPNGTYILDAGNGNTAVLSLSSTTTVRSLGAKGDGVTDDSDSFDDMAALVGYIKMPRGYQYRITRQITNVNGGWYGESMELFSTDTSNYGSVLLCDTAANPSTPFIIHAREMRNIMILGTDKSQGAGLSIYNSNPYAFLGWSKYQNVRVRGFDLNVDVGNVFILKMDNFISETGGRGMRCEPLSNGGDNGYFTTWQTDGLTIRDNDDYGLRVSPSRKSPNLSLANFNLEGNNKVSGTYQGYINNCDPISGDGMYLEGADDVDALLMESGNIGELKNMFMNGCGDLSFTGLNTINLNTLKISPSAFGSIKASGGANIKLAIDNSTVYFGGQLEFSSTTGDFTAGETVTGGTSGSTATVSTVGAIINGVKFTDETGAFTVGETITGGTSGATGVVSVYVARSDPAISSLRITDSKVNGEAINTSNKGTGASFDFNGDAFKSIKTETRAFTGRSIPANSLSTLFGDVSRNGIMLNAVGVASIRGVYEPGLILQVTPASTGSENFYGVHAINTTSSPITLVDGTVDTVFTQVL